MSSLMWWRRCCFCMCMVAVQPAGHNGRQTNVQAKPACNFLHARVVTQRNLGRPIAEDVEQVQQKQPPEEDAPLYLRAHLVVLDPTPVATAAVTVGRGRHNGDHGTQPPYRRVQRSFKLLRHSESVHESQVDCERQHRNPQVLCQVEVLLHHRSHVAERGSTCRR